MSSPVAFVCAMPMELAPLVRAAKLTEHVPGPVEAAGGTIGSVPVVAVVTGMGTALATAGVVGLLEAMAVERVVVVGIAGALGDDLPIGALLDPDRVIDGDSGAEFRPAPLGSGTPQGALWTSDSIVSDPAVLDRLRQRRRGGLRHGDGGHRCGV